MASRTTKPLVSVVMSVYNCEEYLREALDSILAQTYEYFELIVINDGSKDKSLEIIQSYDDARIRLISRENKGLTYSLNEGIALAKGAYVARHDGDDISTPDRFERQVAALESDPGLGMIGSNYTIIDEQGNEVVTTQIFCHPDDLKLAEPVSNQFGHGSVMMRKSVLDQVGHGPYDASVGIVEDYDLFIRISKVAKLANIADPLYRWRRNPVGVTSSNTDTHMSVIAKVRNREFEYIKQHWREYKLFSSFHPVAYRPSVRVYLEKKSILCRDLAFLYWSNDGNRQQALTMMLGALMYAPWRRRNYRLLLWVVRQRTVPEAWQFEFL